MSRWRQWCRTESKSLWQSFKKKKTVWERERLCLLFGFMCAPLCSCTCLLSFCHCVCVSVCPIVFAAVCLSIYPHIVSRLSHPLNDARPHFSLIVLGCSVTASGHCQPHQLSPICCITCGGPPYLPDCARRLCSWMDQTCEVKSGPSSLKEFPAVTGTRAK